MPIDTDKIKNLLFEALSSKPGEEREAFIVEHCGNDRELRESLQALIEAHEGAGDYLEAPVVDGINVRDPELIGSTIGPYKLLEQIGEGGMGVVYMAQQEEPVRRRVALKIVRAGMDSRSVVARFEAERQALALMDHPSIAKVLDAGTTESGRPYFVMELVQAVPITRFCEENLLPIHERLGLFIRVCRAVQHAHQKGVIHRDLKPSNILVTRSEGEPHPVVIDFGVAKALNQRLTEKTLFTNFGHMIGTPAYMSPEQAEMSREDIDTRTDVYSLGVLLCELLTGTTPFPEERLRTLGFDEMRRVIREEEPQRPSALLNRLNGRSQAVAQNRSLEPSELIRRVRGDLDWIVLKALDKARSRRYDTPNELAADLERHLADEPVLARPPSRIYQIQKFTRRHRMTVMAGGAVAAALVIGLSLALLGLRSASKEKEIAGTEHARAELEAREARLNAYAALINLAQRHIEEGSRDRAHSILSACVPQDGEEDIRGWEWRYLWAQLPSDAVGTLGKHEDGVASVAFSPSGRLIASADLIGNVVIRDLQASAILHSWKDDGCVNDVVFCSDSMVASAGNVGIIQFHNLKIGESMVAAELETPIQALAVSPDGLRIAALTGYYANEAVIVWNLSPQLNRSGFPTASSHFEIAGLDSSRGSYFQGAVAFSPDSDELSVGYSDGTVRTYRAGDASLVRVLDGESAGIVRSLEYSPDGRFISANAIGNGEALVWDALSGDLITAVKGHTRSSRCVSFSRDSQFLFTVDGEQNIRQFDTGDWSLRGEYRGPLSRIYDLAVSPVDDSLVTGGLDGDIWMWNAAESSERFKPLEIPSMRDLDFSPNSERLATVEPVKNDPAKWRVRLRSTDGREIEEELVTLGDQVSDVVFSADGRLLAAMDRDGWSVWNIGTHRIENRGSMPRDQDVVLVGFTQDDTGLLFVDSEFLVTVLNRAPGRTESQWPASSGNRLPTFFSDWNVAFHSSSDTLVLGGEGAAVVWDVENRVLKGALDSSVALDTYPAITADGKLIAVVEGNGRVTLWAADTLRFLKELEGQLRFANSVAFSPDGRRLAVGMASKHGTVRILDVATGMDLIGLPEGDGFAYEIGWSPDGNTFFTRTREGNVYSP